MEKATIDLSNLRIYCAHKLASKINNKFTIKKI